MERFVPETRTKGGIMIPEKAQAKVQSATVVAVGLGARNEVRIFIVLGSFFEGGGGYF